MCREIIDATMLKESRNIRHKSLVCRDVLVHFLPTRLNGLLQSLPNNIVVNELGFTGSSMRTSLAHDFARPQGKLREQLWTTRGIGDPAGRILRPDG